MARGEPCTHIYRLNERTKPVVAFHCEHLDRQFAERGTATLKRVGIMPAVYELAEFQLGRSTEGHGVARTHAHAQGHAH